MVDSTPFKSLCGVATLCAAAIFSLFAVAFVGIAFATDNWQHVTVNRNKLQVTVNTENDTKLNEEFYTDVRYFDRVEGLFRVCFPMQEKPPVDHQTIYLNPVDEWCTNIEYYMQSLDKNGLIPEKVTKNAEAWIHVARSCVAAFVGYFAIMGIAFVIGFLGCWKVSSHKMNITAVLMFAGFVFGVAGMALFHAAKHFEHFKVFDERMKFFQTWPEYLQENTTYTFGWSYIVCWMGITLSLFAALLFGVAATTLKLFKISEKAIDIEDELITHATEVVDQTYNHTLRRFGSVASLRGQMPPSIIQHVPMPMNMYNPSLIPNYSKDYQSLPHISDEAASYMDFNSDMKYLTADRPNYVIADRPNGASNKMVRELKDSRL